MNKINKDWLLEEYNDTVQKAEQELSRNNRLHAIWLCEYAGYLAWKYPFLYNFSDDKLERTIQEINTGLHNLSFISQENRIIFYNSQIIDNGALTQQYLQYFIDNNYTVLFIVPEKKRTKLGKEVLNTISNSPNIELFVLSGSNDLNKIYTIRKKIQQYKPSFAFLHLLPNDIIGCLSFLDIKPAKSVYIVHNDHTFWLGKNFFDYYIEFRQFGISLAVGRRGIPLKKILHIPYYPIQNKEPFKGFPFDTENKIIGISGANLYKYLTDPELKYFHIIKELLKENPNFIFCLCGWGDEQTILNFITENKLQDRFYFLGRRSDFYNLVGQCDILFESYPLKGGLTPLFATEQHIPVIGIATYDNFSGSLEELLDIEGYNQPKSLSEFKTEAEKLIQDANYREYLSNILEKNKYNRKDFEESLTKLISGNVQCLQTKTVKPLNLNDQTNLQEYLNLKETNVENISRIKFFILKTYIPIWNRIKSLRILLKSSNTQGIYGVLRVLKLTLIGH